MDDLEGLLSMERLTEFDMGKFTMKLLQGTDRSYKIKTEQSLSWLSTMVTYRREGRFCDVIFSIQDQQFLAHKIVLASVAPVLSQMFQQTTYLQGCSIELIDFSCYVTCPIVMNLLLDFLYTFEVQLNEKTVRECCSYYLDPNRFIPFR